MILIAAVVMGFLIGCAFNAFKMPMWLVVSLLIIGFGVQVVVFSDMMEVKGAALAGFVGLASALGTWALLALNPKRRSKQ